MIVHQLALGSRPLEASADHSGLPFYDVDWCAVQEHGRCDRGSHLVGELPLPVQASLLEGLVDSVVGVPAFSPSLAGLLLVLEHPV